MTIRNLDQFLESDARSEWVYEPGIRMYVRKALPTKAAEGIHLQLASLDADVRGVGALTAVLERYEPLLGIMVESILEPRLIPYLERRGYRIHASHAQVNAFKPRHGEPLVFVGRQFYSTSKPAF